MGVTTSRGTTGFTVLEVLVGLGIVMILLSLLMPATQMAREGARRLQCANHLRNLGLAALQHEVDHQIYPSDGWGFRWVGDPDRGYGPDQPGGWVYDILAYIDQDSVRSMGAGARGAEKRSAMNARFGMAPELLYCPSRRNAGAYPFTESRFGLVNADPPRTAAKVDYAINAGSVELDGGIGPASEQDHSYAWPSLDRMNGISFVRSRVRVRDVRDGTSNTIMLGEKYVPSSTYLSGASIGDDQSFLVGDDADIRRYTVVSPVPDIVEGGLPGVRLVHAFGSAHPNGAQFVFCDGSVRQIPFGTDEHVFQKSGGRYDGFRR